MNLIQRRPKLSPLLLAFAIPCVGMLMVMLFSGYSPFGSYSMLYSDMYHQYYPFFVSFRSALRSGDSLLYSWNVGMGMDYLGLISYYLASPLYLLSVIVPESWLLPFFSLLMPIKLGLASTFFAWMLKELFGRDDYSVSLFGAFYGLCAWALGYQWNIMWLDSFALLPLVALGAVRLLRERKCVLYTVSLFFAVAANYYVGFFVCIFVALLFFCYELCRGRGVGRFFADLGVIFLFSALAIGMTLFLELPALAALQNTQSSVNAFPTGFRLNIASQNTWRGLLDAMRQVAGNLGGGIEPTFKEGLPNVYCGVGTVFLALLFLTDRKAKLRDKICSVFLLLFFILSFIIRQLDYIWHGFHFTNMIPYRFSFLVSFVLLYMAYRAYLHWSEFRFGQITIAAIFALGVFACSDHRLDPAFLAYNLSACVLFVAVVAVGAWRKRLPAEAEEELICREEERRHRVKLRAGNALAILMAIELVLNLVNFGIRFPGTNAVNYPNGTEQTASVIRYMKEREAGKPFYRAEVTHSQTLNDGALNGYNGISTFTSSANVKVTEFMQALGYAAKNTYNRYCFEEGSPVANLFLNLKYMIERDDNLKENRYFNVANHFGKVSLLENNAWLPLGFLADDGLAGVDFDLQEGFRLQNTLFSAATGEWEPVWEILPDSALELTSVNAVANKVGKDGSCNYSECDSSASVSYHFTAPSNGFMCIRLDLPKRNSFTVYRNGEYLYNETISLPQMLSVCDLFAGDEVEVEVSCKENESSTMTVQAAIVNDSVFRSGYEKLAACPWELTEFSNTFVSGAVNCDRDGILYTSISDDGNWIILVDGKETEPTLIGRTMYGVALTQGSHTVTFRYHNDAFSLGWKISLVCAGIVIALSLAMYQPWRKKGEYEK